MFWFAPVVYWGVVAVVALGGATIAFEEFSNDNGIVDDTGNGTRPAFPIYTPTPFVDPEIPQDEHGNDNGNDDENGNEHGNDNEHPDQNEDPDEFDDRTGYPSGYIDVDLNGDPVSEPDIDVYIPPTSVFGMYAETGDLDGRPLFSFLFVFELTVLLGLFIRRYFFRRC